MDSTTPYTVDDVLSWGPCLYRVQTREYLENLWAGREHITVTEMLDLNISAEDKVWHVVRTLSSRDTRLFACDCAVRALLFERNAGREPYDKNWVSVETARRYALGEVTDDELADTLYACTVASKNRWLRHGDDREDVNLSTSAAINCCVPNAVHAAQGVVNNTVGYAAIVAAVNAAEIVRREQGPWSQTDYASAYTAGWIMESEWQLSRLKEYIRSGTSTACNGSKNHEYQKR